MAKKSIEERLAKNAEYWRKRFQQLEEARHKDVQSLLPDIDRIYKQAQAEMEREIRAWYQRIADNNGVSMAEARKLLSKNELKEFKWTVEEYIKRGKENAMDQRWIKELENASAKFHINRLEALKLQVQQSLEVVYGNQLDQLDTSMRELYQEGYYRTAFELQKGFRIGFPVAAVDQNKLDKLIKKPWAPDGKNFSDRIWQNKARLISEVHIELTRMCLTGAAPDAAIRNIAKKMNTSRYNAGRLVMTEAAYFGSVSQKKCFSDLDVEQYEICATPDSHTSDICQSLDGKVFDMKDYEAGVTAPPFHVFCRTCTVPYFNDEFTAGELRAARGTDGKTYYVPADTKYPEWKKQFIDSSKTGLQKVTLDDKIKSEDRSHALPAKSPEVQKILDRYPVIKGAHSFDADIVATNPKYKDSQKKQDTYYTHNCQRCVNAYEARRRGYDVTASARLLKNDTLPYMMNDKGWANVYENGRANLVKCVSNSSHNVKREVREQLLSWGDGARAIVRVQWKGGAGGHVFIAECHGSDVHFLDPQNGNLDVGDYFNYAKVNQTYVLRIDNMEFDVV